MANAVLKGDEIARNPNGYLALATRAAELEREEKYIAAREMWDAAYRASENTINRQWAACRSAFCHTCITRFGKRAA